MLNVENPAISGALSKSAPQTEGWTLTKKLLVIMNITAIILFTVLLQVSAKGFTQTVSLSLKTASLETAFQEIEKQTGFSFIYGKEQLQGTKTIDLNVRNEKLENVLKLIFKNQPLDYTISGKYIALKQKAFPEKKEETTQPPPIDVRGRVVNESGEPVAGASVMVKGTNQGTNTNGDGYFELKNIDENATLIISAVHIEPYEVRVNGRTDLATIGVRNRVTAQEEVIVNAGYYTVKERKSTGSISRIDAQTIGQQPVSNPLQAMQGRMSGVYIQQASGITGSNFEVRIRGRNGIETGNDPFYIIDGVPFNSISLSTTTTSGNIHGASGVSPLNTLNTNDIESIEVLKDADATAIYGSRGANGVVLITTKKGRSGKTRLDLNINSGISHVAKKMNLLNTEQYLQMRNEAFENDNLTPNFWDYDVNGTWSEDRYTDWQKVLIGGTGRSINSTVSLSGGNAATQFLFSGGYQKQSTVFPGNHAYEKGSTHLSVNHKSIDGKLDALFSVNYIADKNNLLNNDFTAQALSLAPNAPKLYDEQGELNWEDATWDNPIAFLENKYKAYTNNLIGNTVLRYRLLKDFEVSTNLGLNTIRFKDRNMFPSTVVNPVYGLTPAISRLQMNTNEINSWIVEPQLTYQKSIGKAKFSSILGSTFQEQISEQIVHIGVGFSSNALIENIAAASFKAVSQYNYQQYRYNALFGRFNVEWDEKYIVNLTGRRDGSSRFGPGKQFANFGAVGFAWIFTNEDFLMNRSSFISFGKFRSSYGVTGNDQIGDYEYLDNYLTGDSYQGVTGLEPLQLFNPNFMWELNRKFEGALALGFLDDKITVNIAYFQNKSSNQLLGYTLPATTGFSSIRKNLSATVLNSGLELELATLNIRRNQFEWSSSFNLTVPRNKLLKFQNLENSSYRNTFSIGNPLNIRKLYQLSGIDPMSGLFLVDDLDNDGSITSSDRLSIKAIGQTAYGGLFNSLSYKGMRLDFFFQFVKQTAPSYLSNSGIAPGIGVNQPDNVLNRWRPGSNTYTIQRYTAGYDDDAINAFFRYSQSDASIVDASFLRLKNLSFTYSIPERLTKKIKVNLYLQGQNIWTITNYVGLDPENYGRLFLPPLRTFIAGVQLSI